MKSSEKGSEGDPLEKIVASKEEVNRKRLSEALDGLMNIDDESGDAIALAGYYDLPNKDRFVTRLLARRAAFELEFIGEDKLGTTSGELADKMEPSTSTIQNYGGLNFVENSEERGGYFIPGHFVERAVKHLERE